MNKERILNGFTKFSLGAMAVTFVAIIIVATAINIIGINPETATIRAFLILIASLISYFVLLKFKVFKRISEFVNATALN